MSAANLFALRLLPGYSASYEGESLKQQESVHVTGQRSQRRELRRVYCDHFVRSQRCHVPVMMPIQAGGNLKIAEEWCFVSTLAPAVGTAIR
jgi:hypothetical protein